MTTNESAPDPTAGERCPNGRAWCDGPQTAGCCDPCAATPPADDGRLDASEPLTEAEREAVDRASLVFGWQHLVRYSGQTDDWLRRTLTAIVLGAREDVAAREAAAATKARADERERVLARVGDVRRALDPDGSKGRDLVCAQLRDAADRVGNPSHRGNEHAWREHAEMFRNLANVLAAHPAPVETRQDGGR